MGNKRGPYYIRRKVNMGGFMARYEELKFVAPKARKTS